MKMKSAHLHFKHPNILCTLDELSGRFFFWGGRGLFDCESSSEVRKMLGCLKCKYADCIFIRRFGLDLPMQEMFMAGCEEVGRSSTRKLDDSLG